MFLLQVAAWLVGNGAPLTQVVQQLWQQLKSQDASTAQTQDSLRNCVIDLATRKSFGVKAGNGPWHGHAHINKTLSDAALADIV